MNVNWTGSHPANLFIDRSIDHLEASPRSRNRVLPIQNFSNHSRPPPLSTDSNYRLFRFLLFLFIAGFILVLFVLTSGSVITRLRRPNTYRSSLVLKCVIYLWIGITLIDRVHPHLISLRRRIRMMAVICAVVSFWSFDDSSNNRRQKRPAIFHPIACRLGLLFFLV